MPFRFLLTALHPTSRGSFNNLRSSEVQLLCSLIPVDISCTKTQKKDGNWAVVVLYRLKNSQFGEKKRKIKELALGQQ